MPEQITITNIQYNPDNSRYGFAVNHQGEGVYIPVTAMSAIPDAKIGDRTIGILMQNGHNPKGLTPWFCTAIPQEDTAAVWAAHSPPERGVSAQEVLEYINACDSAVTASDVAEDLDITKERSSTTLVNLHAAADISRIALYRRQGSSRATSAAYVANHRAVKIFNTLRGEVDHD